MEPEKEVVWNRCECGGKASPGRGDYRGMMFCNRPSCKKRWLVRTCNCGNRVDFRYHRYCKKNYQKCNLVPHDICIYGSQAKIGFEGVMCCIDKDCVCHHNRWAYHECEHCGQVVDYRYAVMCVCKECTKSLQYYRICPVCGQCPSQIQNENEDGLSQVVRSTRTKNSRLTASKKVVTKKLESPAQLSLTS